MKFIACVVSISSDLKKPFKTKNEEIRGTT